MNKMIFTCCLTVVAVASYLQAEDVTANEVSLHPEILISRTVDGRKLSLHGVRLGDPESRIPMTQIASRKDNYGIVKLKNGDSYYVADGEVSRPHF